MKFLKKVIAILLLLFLLFLLAFNISLLYEPDFEKHDNSFLNEDLIHQLAHVKERIHEGAGLIVFSLLKKKQRT